MGYRDPALHILASSLLVFAFQFAPCVAPRDAAAESIFLAAAAQGAGSNALQLGSGHYFARGINLSSAEFNPGKNPGSTARTTQDRRRHCGTTDDSLADRV